MNESYKIKNRHNGNEVTWEAKRSSDISPFTAVYEIARGTFQGMGKERFIHLFLEDLGEVVVCLGYPRHDLSSIIR
jgi:hypothetical protein